MITRRGFFGSVAAVITATVIPIKFPRKSGFIASTYSAGWNYDSTVNAWWSAGDKVTTKIDSRTIAYLEQAWQACIKGGQHPSQIYITDEQLMELGDEIHRSRRA